MSSHHISAPTAKDIFRYRSHHGVNLGGIFVLERWLFPAMFDSSVAGDSEHDAVISSINKIGVEAARRKWQSHWSTALTESDLHYLATTAHITTLRLPIGYFTLGRAFTNHTPFAMLPSQIYLNAWSSVCNLIRRAHAHGIGVLIDLHAPPGGANVDSHSGTSSGTAELWGNDFNLSLAKRCLVFIAQELQTRGLGEGVVGIQLCNEATYDAPGLYEWYDDVTAAIEAIDPTIPLYVSDAWDLPRALEYSLRKNIPRAEATNPVIIDTHRYYTFAASDTSRSPRQIIDQVFATELSEVATHSRNIFDNHSAVGVFVGEWSCALAPSSWKQVPASQRGELRIKFGKTQVERWRTCPAVGGSAFWTFKMGSQSEAKAEEWAFKQQGESGTITPPSCSMLSKLEVLARLEDAEAMRQKRMVKAMEAHAGYWDNIGSTTDGDENGTEDKEERKRYFEHWRYADGWHLGWCDARDFFQARVDGVVIAVPGSDGVGEGVGAEASAAIETANTLQANHDDDTPNAGGAAAAAAAAVVAHPIIGADRIGLLDLWVLKRMRDEGVLDKDTCAFGWEWEHGFRKGVRDFEEVVGMGR